MKQALPRPTLLQFLCLIGSVLLAPLTAPVAAAAQDEFFGLKVVHLLQEPRHRTVHQQGGLFLLDVQINPGDESFPHTHNQAILLTRISAAEGPQFGAVEAITRYVTDPLTHQVANPGPEKIHIMALVSDGRGVPPGTDDEPSGDLGQPTVENAWFRSYRLRLEPGEATPQLTPHNPTVIIQVEGGELHVSRPDGLIHELSQPGHWAWRQRGESFSVRNNGDSTVTVVINEGRRQH